DPPVAPDGDRVTRTVMLLDRPSDGVSHGPLHSVGQIFRVIAGLLRLIGSHGFSAGERRKRRPRGRLVSECRLPPGLTGLRLSALSATASTSLVLDGARQTAWLPIFPTGSQSRPTPSAYGPQHTGRRGERM